MRLLLLVTALLGAASSASGQQLGLSGRQARLFGFAFTYTTYPITTNFNRTPVAHRAPGDAGSIFKLEYRNIRVLWGDNAIGSLGKVAGFDEIDYADISTLDILGVFTMYRVRVYGRTADEVEAEKLGLVRTGPPPPATPQPPVPAQPPP
jgi:TRL (tRNA-associated locus)-like protein